MNPNRPVQKSQQVLHFHRSSDGCVKLERQHRKGLREGDVDVVVVILVFLNRGVRRSEAEYQNSKEWKHSSVS
jgi:hypothetical protein